MHRAEALQDLEQSAQTGNFPFNDGDEGSVPTFKDGTTRLKVGVTMPSACVVCPEALRAALHLELLFFRR